MMNLLADWGLFDLVRPADLASYLRSTGWVEKPLGRPGALLFEGPPADDGDPLVQIVPVSPRAKDYPLQIVEILRSLADGGCRGQCSHKGRQVPGSQKQPPEPGLTGCGPSALVASRRTIRGRRFSAAVRTPVRSGSARERSASSRRRPRVYPSQIWRRRRPGLETASASRCSLPARQSVPTP